MNTWQENSMSSHDEQLSILMYDKIYNDDWLISLLDWNSNSYPT